MAHIVFPAISETRNIAVWGLQLRTLNDVDIRFRKIRPNNKLVDALFAGYFEIPPQSSTLPEERGTRNQLTVQSWFDAMEGGANTSVLPIKEPTVFIPDGITLTPHNPQMADTVLTLSAIQTGVPVDSEEEVKANVEDLIKLGSPERIYRIIKIDGTAWTLVPGILPLGAIGLIRPATDMIFQLTNSQEQRRERFSRGPWRGEMLEYVGELGTVI